MTAPLVRKGFNLPYAQERGWIVDITSMGITLMKKARTLGALSLAGIVGITSAAETARAQTQTNAQGDTFVMQWTEDFTKQEALDASRWNLCKRPVPTFDSTYGMKLGGGSWISVSPYPRTAWEKSSYVGSTKFGRYSARIYNAPTATQNQAFWLIKPVLTNDDWNEIDIETYNAGWLKGGTIIPVYTLHFGDWTPAVGLPSQRDTTVIHPVGWHDWLMDWTPNYISFYCDGNLRAIFYNSAWKPDWTELNGTGVEAQLFPQSISFTNADKRGPGKDDGAGMAVSSVSYWALDMQSFTAPGYSNHSGGTVGIDSKYRQIPPKERLEEHQYVNDLGPGDYLQYNGVQTKWRNIAIQVDCDTPGRQIEIRTGSPTGSIIGTINVPVTRGPQHIYDDLVIKSDPTRIVSKKRPFDTGNANSDHHIGNTLNITGGAGFTPGAYKIVAVAEEKEANNKGEATLDRPAGEANATGGQGTLQYVNPIRYTLLSANLDARTGAPQDIYLTFAGGKGGVSLYNIFFFGAEPTSKLGDMSGKKTKVFAPEEMLDH